MTLRAGLREPQEAWSEDKRAAWSRLQDIQNRRRQLLRLEEEARDEFRRASAEDPAESLPSAPHGSGSGGDLEEVEVALEPEGAEEGVGFYSSASTGARGAHSDQALGKPRPSSTTRGRSRTRSPKPTASRPSEEAPVETSEDPEPKQVSRYLVTVPKHGKKRKELSPKTSPKRGHESQAGPRAGNHHQGLRRDRASPEAQVRNPGQRRTG